MIHDTAIISKKARIDSDVSIGAYSVIEDETRTTSKLNLN